MPSRSLSETRRQSPGADTSARDPSLDLRLVEYLGSLTSLMGPVTHEIRGKLNITALNLELLEQSVLDQADPVVRTRQQGYLRRVRESVEAHRSQLEALFAAIRPPASDPEKFDWRRDLGSLGILIQAFAERWRTILGLTLPDHAVVVVADSVAVDQVALSLAVWAVESVKPEATPSSPTERPTVRVSLEAGDGTATFSITLPAEERVIAALATEPAVFSVARDLARHYHGRFEHTTSEGDVRLDLQLPLEPKTS